VPDYEYRCTDCHRNVKLFFTYGEFDAAEPVCTHCGSINLNRLISRIGLAKSEDSRFDSMDPDSMLAGLDEEDPRSLGKFMRVANHLNLSKNRCLILGRVSQVLAVETECFSEMREQIRTYLSASFVQPFHYMLT